MNNQVILIVGGAGYIGSHVNHMLSERGYQTIVFDNLSRGHQKAVSKGIFIKGDLGDRAALDQIFKAYSVQAVMHFAAFIDVRESVKDPGKYYVNNVAHTLNLLQAMLAHHVKRFVFSSTAAIFGNPLTSLIDENHTCLPINPYGESKLMVEQILRDFDRAYGLKSYCLRYFNAAGGDPRGEIRNFQTETSLLIPRILLNLKQHKNEITIYGSNYPTKDGTCVRDYIHLEDLGEAHIEALKQLLNGANSQEYNLGNGIGFTVREVVHAVEEVLKKKIKVQEAKRRPGDPAILLANPAKAMKELHWKPRYSLHDMIEHAWAAYPF